MIRLEGVSVRYGAEVVLDRLDLSLAAGSSTAVIGVSGCGKTSLLRVIAGLLVPWEGRVTVAGAPVQGIRPGTGLILQSLGLFPWKTVEGNIALALKPLGLAKDEVASRTAEALTDLGLAGVADKYPSQLSGGQAQRTAIARTLVRRSDLLLMDEPSASLDALTREDFQDLVLTLHRTRPTTLVVVTHGIEEAVVLGQTIVVLTKAGPARVLENPLFGRGDLRSDPGFGPLCQRVRRALSPGGLA